MNEMISIPTPAVGDIVRTPTGHVGLLIRVFSRRGYELLLFEPRNGKQTMRSFNFRENCLSELRIIQKLKNEQNVCDA